jgi:hypothetical protein
MNTRLLTGALCVAFLVCSPHGSPAQTDAPSERPGKPHWKKHGKPGGPMAGLPPEEAQRLAAARDKAKDDPTVRSLKEARDAIDAQLENAMSAAILAADPGLAPTLEKVNQSRDRAKGMRDRFESLTNTTGLRRVLVGGGRLTVQQDLSYNDNSTQGQQNNPNPAQQASFTAQWDQPLLDRKSVV